MQDEAGNEELLNRANPLEARVSAAITPVPLMNNPALTLRRIRDIGRELGIAQAKSLDALSPMKVSGLLTELILLTPGFGCRRAGRELGQNRGYHNLLYYCNLSRL